MIKPSLRDEEWARAMRNHGLEHAKEWLRDLRNHGFVTSATMAS